MRVWVDSSDALFRAVKALGLKKVEDDGRYFDSYVSSMGEPVRFFVGEPHAIENDIVVWREAEQKASEIYDRDVKPLMVPSRG